MYNQVQHNISSRFFQRLQVYLGDTHMCVIFNRKLVHLQSRCQLQADNKCFKEKNSLVRLKSSCVSPVHPICLCLSLKSLPAIEFDQTLYNIRLFSNIVSEIFLFWLDVWQTLKINKTYLVLPVGLSCS